MRLRCSAILGEGEAYETSLVSKNIHRVLVAQGQRVDALPPEIGHAVPATGPAPGMVEAGRNPTDQTQVAVDTRQQRNANAAGDVAAAESGLDLAALSGCKSQWSTATF